MYAFKGFEQDLTCRGFRYKPGELITMKSEPILCYQGFHACILPIHAVAYYPINGSKFRFVKLDGVAHISEYSVDSKVCGNQIIVGSVDVDDIHAANLAVADSIFHKIDTLISYHKKMMLDRLRLPLMGLQSYYYSTDYSDPRILQRYLRASYDFWFNMSLVYIGTRMEQCFKDYNQFIDYVTEDVKELFQ